jgi:DNA-binding NarL/FixJ family response regulator
MEIDSAPGHGTRVTLVAPPPPDASARAAPHRGGSTVWETTEVEFPRMTGQGEAIRVLLADDHPIVRQGLAGLLRTDPSFDVVGEAATGAEALDLAHTLRPQVVVMDVSMPVMNGIDATRAIREEVPGVAVVGLSMHDDAEMEASMRSAGASGYVTKGGPSEALFAAIRSAASDASSSS